MTLAVVMRLRDEIELLSHITANLRHADAIFLCDGGSVDGTWEALQELERRDRRVRASQWPQTFPPFQHQAEHMTFALQQAANERHWDWIQYLDADEICSVDMQLRMRIWLEELEGAEEKIGIETTFLYLAEGWTHYWEDASKYPIIRLWNYIPTVKEDEHGPVVELPDRRISAPWEFMLLHWNWALRGRLEHKQALYEQRYQAPRWYPEQKFTIQERLPWEARWFPPIKGEEEWL